MQQEFTFKTFKDDLFAAFSVALLTVPQSIAYAILAGLPPISGLFSAIFGCIATGIFGSSRYLIVGPTTSVAILLQTSIAEIVNNYYPMVAGREKEILVFNILAHIIFIIGILQLVFCFFNMGKILRFISKSVVLGYFVGVVLAIIINQMFLFFDISDNSQASSSFYKLWHLILNLKSINFYAAFLGLAGVFSLIFLKRRFPKSPNTLWVVVLISFIAYFINKYTGGNIVFLKDTGFTSSAWPVFRFSFLSLDIINKIFPAALAITLLVILEVFSVSDAMSVRSNNRINYDQEIYAVALANTFLSFIFGAMPASGSISRSLFNYNNKAKTNFSALFAGLFCALFIVLFWGLVKHIPLVALSAVLIAMAPSFIDYKQLKFCFTVTKGDALVFLLTMFSCLFFSLHIAFFIGIIISIASYLKRAAIPHVVEYAFNSAGHLEVVSGKKGARRKIRIIGIAGELFFGSVDPFQKELRGVSKDPFVKVIILRLNNVYYMDASMCYAIFHLHEYLKSKNKSLIISGISSEIWLVFKRAGLIKKMDANNLFVTDEAKPQFSTWNACMRARDLI